MNDKHIREANTLIQQIDELKTRLASFGQD